VNGSLAVGITEGAGRGQFASKLTASSQRKW